MEQKYIKKDLESSNENQINLYGQINKLCRDQETLNRNGEYEQLRNTQSIEHSYLSILERNEENYRLKEEIEIYKAKIKKFEICKKLQEQKVESLQKKAKDMREKYENLKFKDEVLKDNPQLLSRLYEYLKEYQDTARFIKNKKICSTVPNPSKGESESIMNDIKDTNKADRNIANNVSDLENPYNIAKQIIHHYNTGVLQDETIKPKAEIETKCYDPVVKRKWLRYKNILSKDLLRIMYLKMYSKIANSED